MNEEVYIQIEAYLAGAMNPEEAQAFEEKIAADPDLAKEVDLYDSINQYLQDENWKSISKSDESEDQTALENFFESEEAQDLEKTLREVQDEYILKKGKPTKKITFLLYAAAITVLLVTSIGYLLLQPKSYDTLYSEYYTPEDLPSLVSRGTVTNRALIDGITAFEQKNYPKAVASFTAYTETKDSPNPLVYSYIGISYLESGDVGNAILAFDQLLNTDSIDNSKALWYKALAYLKSRQKEKLKKTLTTIISNPSNHYHSKAKKLLDEL